MKILIRFNSPEEVLQEVASWLNRAAVGERAFAEVTVNSKRRKAESLYAAICIERLAESISQMDVEIVPEEPSL